MQVTDLGLLPYQQAWEIQEQAHAQVAAGGPEQLFIVQHTPIITLGRRGPTPGNLITSEPELKKAGIELIHSDRGGDITYHGPGQIVAYPIIRLADHRLTISGYMHRLEQIVIATLADLEIPAFNDPKAIGVWVNDAKTPAKICALGVRIRRGVTLHGLALNVTTDLTGFLHIIPCGLTNRSVTSIEKIQNRAVNFDQVKQILIRHLMTAFT